MSQTFDAPWTEVGRYARRRDAEGAALVLASAGIGSRVIGGAEGIAVLVAPADAERASRELIEYDSENRPRPRLELPSIWRGADAAFIYSSLLILIFAAAGRHLFGLDWEAAGAANAGLITAGEWWRALTALTLHADLRHLASNVFAGSVFGLFLAQALGPGLAWLAVVAAAGIANLVYAYLLPAEHASIGASTAVFAALGLLAALMWRRGPSRLARGLRAVLPLAAGGMLLAFLGFGGERVDFGAHIAGFIAGVAGGAALHLAGRLVPQGGRAQAAYGAAALALIAVAWLAALTSA